MRRTLIVLATMVVGVLGAGLATAIAATGIAGEETLVFGEHTIKVRNVNVVGEPDEFKPSDRYLFRSELSDADGVAGYLNAECVVQFARRDTCSVIYEIPSRGTIVAQGYVPVSQLVVGGTWGFAILGGTGEFENVRGSVTVEIVDDELNSEHSLHLLP
jgi:hypothetical protein